MMRFLMVLAFILIGTNAYADESTYMDMDIPVMEGARDVSLEKNDKFYTRAVSYKLTLEDIDTVHHFYDAYFIQQGWHDVMKNFSKKRDNKWSGVSAHIDLEGNPIFSAASTWQKKRLPVNAAVNIVIDQYQDKKFEANISVTLGPAIVLEEMFRITGKITKDPKTIFILREALGKNPYDISSIDWAAIPAQYSDDPLIIEYKKIGDAMTEKYKEFGAQYVLRTKPIDGSFDTQNPWGGEAQLSDFADEDVNDTDTAFSPCHVKAEIDKSIKGNDEKTQDPLHRWRELQEQSNDATCLVPTLWQCLFGQ